jgi:hypothetical protein
MDLQSRRNKMDILIYLGIILGVTSLVAFSVYIRNKFNIKTQDIEFAMLVLGLVDYVTSKTEWKYKEGASTVMGVVAESLEITLETYSKENLNKEVLSELVFLKSKELCEHYGMEVDLEFEKMLRMVVAHLIG